MISIIVRTVIIAVFVLAGLWVGVAYVTEDVVHENVRNKIRVPEGQKGPPREFIARIIWHRTFPWYNAVDVFLVVVDNKGRTLLRRPLLKDLDDPEQVAERVRGLDWENDETLVLIRRDSGDLADIVQRFPFEVPDPNDEGGKD